MTTVHVALASARGRAATGSTLGIPDTTPVGTPEEFTASGVNQATVALATTKAGQIWVVTVEGGTIKCDFAAAPNAAATPKWRLPSGVWYFASSAAGEKFAHVGV